MADSRRHPRPGCHLWVAAQSEEAPYSPCAGSSDDVDGLPVAIADTVGVSHRGGWWSARQAHTQEGIGLLLDHYAGGLARACALPWRPPPSPAGRVGDEGRPDAHRDEGEPGDRSGQYGPRWRRYPVEGYSSRLAVNRRAVSSLRHYCRPRQWALSCTSSPSILAERRLPAVPACSVMGSRPLWMVELSNHDPSPPPSHMNRSRSAVGPSHPIVPSRRAVAARAQLDPVPDLLGGPPRPPGR